MASKVLQASGSKLIFGGDTPRLPGSRTLQRERSQTTPPAAGADGGANARAQRVQASPSQQFPFPMGNDPAPAVDPSTAPPGSLSSLTPQQFSMRRAQAGMDGAEAGRLAADANTRAQLRPNVTRGENEGGGQSFQFPMGTAGEGGRTQREQAINLASRVTHTPRGYLLAIAAQEGMDRNDAQNPRSSAHGLTQFTEGTWLSVMRDHGAAYGVPRELVDQIRQRQGGGFYVASAEARNQLLALRGDPEWSLIMAGHLFHREAETIRNATGRPVTVADVYMGHFLGGDAAGYVLSQISLGHGNVEARTAIRRYYARNPGQAQEVISSNPRQFAPGVTLAQLYRMQTGDLIARGEQRGVPASEMRAVVQGPPVSDMGKQSRRKQMSNAGRDNIMSPEEITTQANQRDWNVRTPNRDPNQPRVDPETGQVPLPLPEQQRQQEREQRARDEEAVRRNRRSVTLRRDGLRVRQPF